MAVAPDGASPSGNGRRRVDADIGRGRGGRGRSRRRGRRLRGRRRGGLGASLSPPPLGRRRGGLGAVDRFEDLREGLETLHPHSAHFHEPAEMLNRLRLLPGASRADDRERIGVTGRGVSFETPPLRLDGGEADGELRRRSDRSFVRVVRLLRERGDGKRDHHEDREQEQFDAMHRYILTPPFRGL